MDYQYQYQYQYRYQGWGEGGGMMAVVNIEEGRRVAVSDN